VSEREGSTHFRGGGNVPVFWWPFGGINVSGPFVDLCIEDKRATVTALFPLNWSFSQRVILANDQVRVSQYRGAKLFSRVTIRSPEFRRIIFWTSKSNAVVEEFRRRGFVIDET
jgi:hypothetical protein